MELGGNFGNLSFVINLTGNFCNLYTIKLFKKKNNNQLQDDASRNKKENAISLAIFFLIH
jgi:hypothetical protein